MLFFIGAEKPFRLAGRNTMLLGVPTFALLGIQAGDAIRRLS